MSQTETLFTVVIVFCCHGGEFTNHGTKVKLKSKSGNSERSRGILKITLIAPIGVISEKGDASVNLFKNNTVTPLNYTIYNWKRGAPSCGVILHNA